MTDLYETLKDRLEQVQEHGHYFSAICPFPHNGHKEAHPSLLVYQDGFHCQGCHKGGKLEYLLSRVDKSFSLPTSIKPTKSTVLPRWLSWEKQWGDLRGIADAGHRALKTFPDHQWYFKKRKIDHFINAGHFGSINGWMLFPVFDAKGRIIDIVARAGTGKGDTKYVVKKVDLALTPLYVPNWQRVLESDTVFVVYGIIDAWAFEDLGLPCVTGITGKSLSYKHLKEFDKRWIIIPDKGEEDAAEHLANKTGWRATAKRLKWPPECKDPDEIRVKIGPKALRTAIGM